MIEVWKTASVVPGCSWFQGARPPSNPSSHGWRGDDSLVVAQSLVCGFYSATGDTELRRKIIPGR